MEQPQHRRYHFINLPHANTILNRIVRWLGAQDDPAPGGPYGRLGSTPLPDLLAELDRSLRPFVEDPPEETALPAADSAAALARLLVEEMEKAGYRGDRLGQCVRNLFECLGLPEEGAELSLKCGERPDSPLRP